MENTSKGHSTEQHNSNGNKSTREEDLQQATSRTGWTSFERTSSVRSEGSAPVSSDLNVKTHSKQNSEPATLGRSSSVNEGYKHNKKASPAVLEEYQKWKVTGRKGDPPAKLKISQ